MKKMYRANITNFHLLDSQDIASLLKILFNDVAFPVNDGEFENLKTKAIIRELTWGDLDINEDALN